VVGRPRQVLTDDARTESRDVIADVPRCLERRSTRACRAHKMTPNRPDDSLLDILLQAVGALATGSRRPGERESNRACRRSSCRTLRVPITPRLAARVMQSDFFRCRYCGTRIIPAAVLRAASLVWPDELPYHVHWKASATHPLYLSHAGSIDHIELTPRRRYRIADKPGNGLLGCNVQKGDLSLARLGWQLQPQVPSDWDGLVGYYPAIWKVAQSKATEDDARFHLKWLVRSDGQRPIALKMDRSTRSRRLVRL